LCAADAAPGPFPNEAASCTCANQTCACDGSDCGDFNTTDASELVNYDSSLQGSALCSDAVNTPECRVCSCAGITNTNSGAPSVSYLKSVFDAKAPDDRRLYCNPETTASMANDQKCDGCTNVSGQLKAAHIASWIFVLLSAAPAFILFLANCRNRSTMVFSYWKGDMSIWSPQDKTWLFWVTAMSVLVCILEDIPQTIINLQFLMAKFSDHGVDCIDNFVNAPLVLHGLTIDRSADDLIGLMMENHSVGLSILSTVLNVLFVGFLLLRVVVWYMAKDTAGHQIENAIRATALVTGLLCAVVFLMVILTPYWGVLWADGSDFLNLGGSNDVFKILFFVGLGSWGVFCCGWFCICCASCAGDGDCGCDCC